MNKQERSQVEAEARQLGEMIRTWDISKLNNYSWQAREWIQSEQSYNQSQTTSV